MSVTCLPQEIIDEIAELSVVRTENDVLDVVNHKDNLVTLARLSHTCKMLSRTCAPTLFKRIVIHADRGDKKGVGLLMALRRRPELGSYIKAFCTSKWYFSTGSPGLIHVENVQHLSATDSVARGSLNGGAEWVTRHYLVFLILQRIVALRELGTHSGIMTLAASCQAQRRLNGSSLKRVRLFWQSDSADELDWLSAFEPKRLPLEIESLQLHYGRDGGISHICDGHVDPLMMDWPTREGQIVAASLRHFALNLRDSGQRSIVQWESFFACINIVHLSVHLYRTTYDELIRDLSSLPYLKENLQTLEIRSDALENIDSSYMSSETLQALGQFVQLRSLTVPLLPTRSDEGVLMTWPPALQALSLQYARFRPLFPIHDVVYSLRFRHFPETLKSITMEWRAFFDRYLSFYMSNDAIRLLLPLKHLDTWCRSRDVGLLHCVPHKNEANHYKTLEELEQQYFVPVVEELKLHSLTSEERKVAYELLNTGESDLSFTEEAGIGNQGEDDSATEGGYGLESDSEADPGSEDGW